MIKVTHLTSAHSRYDTRIFLKMCSSLAKNENYHVSLVVADGKGDELKNNVQIFDAGAKQGGRLSRMTKTVNKVFNKAKELDSDIYHLHDPELMPIGLRFKKLGKRVVFDAHEDLPKQLLGKPYLNKLVLWGLSKFFAFYERVNLRKYDYIITATPYIRDKFLEINKKSIDINNFPILGELAQDVGWQEKERTVCYVGGITSERGIKELVHAMAGLDDVRLSLVGTFSEVQVEQEVKNYEGWGRVDQLGFLDRLQVADVMGRSVAGVVTFHPLPNHVDAQPNKMFEYMSAGLPIITSNFVLWEDIVKGNQCGICVDPLDSNSIANAINYLVNHPQKAEQMGKNGKQAVLTKYNWNIEEKKLFDVYSQLGFTRGGKE